MKFTSAHAKTIMRLITRGCTLTDIQNDKAYDALAALNEVINNGEFREVWITVTGDRWVDGIKLIRTITGWGLKQSKDWMDERNSSQTSGTFGPLIIDPVEIEKLRADNARGDFSHIINAKLSFF